MPFDLTGKWPRYVGSAFAGLFLLLLAIRLGYFEKRIPDKDRLPSVLPRPIAGEAWLTIAQGGKKIGYAHRLFLPTLTGYRLSEDVRMCINTMGTNQALFFTTEGELDPRMNLTSFRFILNSSLFHFAARGFVRDNLLTVHVGERGKGEKLEITLKAPLHLTTGILETARASGLKPGESRIFHIFDPAAMGAHPVRVTLAAQDEIIWHRGQKRHARKFSLDFMGATQFAWVSPEGETLREKGLLDITLEKATREEAKAGLNRWEGADLTELSSIIADKIIPNPEELSELKLRLENLREEIFFLNGGRQSWQKHILTVSKETWPLSGLPARLAKNRNALQPDPFIQSTHPLIVAKAHEITVKVDTDAVKARKLLAWVHRHVRKRPVLSVPNALETLQKMVGDCNEHAVLLAALARAAGIPAEVETGIVYLRGRFYYHAWNSLFLGGQWITADAVLGQLPTDVTHIRFVRGAPAQQLDLIGLIGRLKISIVDYATLRKKDLHPKGK